MPAIVPEKNLLTFTALSTFRSCPRKYKHRYEDNLKSHEKQKSLFFGQVIHESLTLFYRTNGDLNPAYRYLDQSFPNYENDAAEKAARFLAYVMMAGYAERYAENDFEVVDLNVEFIGEIYNPRTGRQSRTFRMAGKTNGVVKINGKLYLLEHRTASSSEEIDPDKLWADTQATLYCHYLRQCGYPIVGVVYNILLKSRIQQKSGETEEEFEQRRTELAAKNKSGKSSAQRQTPETDLEFVERLKEWYQKPEAFQRVILQFPEERMNLLQEEIWEVTQQYLSSRRRDSWLMNTASCFHFGRPCEYLKYCQSGFNQELCDILFENVLPHEELPILGLNLRAEERQRYEEIRREKEKAASV
jgi:hypothetical protein